MQLSLLEAAKVIYEARRAIGALPGKLVVDGDTELDVLPPAPFDQLTGEQREPLLAEVQQSRQGGAPMHDVLGQAIEDALK